MKKITTSLFVSLCFAASFSVQAGNNSEPVNSLDCSHEEVLDYASKDNYEEPLGVSVMPSTREFEPAHISKERKEDSSSGDDEENKGCPNLGKHAQDAWDEAKEKYESLVSGVQSAMDAFNSMDSGSMIDLGSFVDRAKEKIREAANKPICERMIGAASDLTSEVMWDAVEQRYGVDEDAFNEGNKSFLHELIKNQNSQSGSELKGLFEKMGAKDEGEELMDFLADSGLEQEDIKESLGEEGDDQISDELGERFDDVFGDNDGPFSDTEDQIRDDAEEQATGD